tara:strand:- start:130 stop:447 length:318 start_codon:yes stop_codon:yes gene_type:complete
MVVPLLYGLYVIGSGTAARVAVRKLAQTGAKVAGNLVSRHRTKKAAEKASELFMKASPKKQLGVASTIYMETQPVVSESVKKAIRTGKKKAGFKKGGRVPRRKKK